MTPLRVRFLGRVRYRDAHALQHALFRRSSEDYLLLLEHGDVFTLGVRARPEHVLVDDGELGAELVRVDRGGDVTYHGPGQLVGYPIVSVPLSSNAIPDYVGRIEQLVIDTLSDLGLTDVGRLEGLPGVWVGLNGPNPRKICAIGVRVSRGRSMHGFALNIDPDMSMFERIVPCGIADHSVTSLRHEGIEVSMSAVVDAICRRAASALGHSEIERQDATLPTTAQSAPVGEAVAVRPSHRRLAAAGVELETVVEISQRKPSWLRVEANMGKEYLGLRKTMRSLDLVTVCEEAGCPNIYECWADGTATFMINGSRCTRACGFCLVDTRHPLPLEADEPDRVARAVEKMHLSHAVITAVARDDLADGGALAFANTIEAIRATRPATTIEVLISDCKGDDESLRTIFDAAPHVLNHNLETVLRLQRAVRPSASYARSLSVLGRAKAAGLTTKSGIMVGLGETNEEIVGALHDLSGVGVDIVTLGQYLRPSSSHLPVSRFMPPEEFAELAEIASGLAFSHVEASPLTRSSYHAKGALAAATQASESA